MKPIRLSIYIPIIGLISIFLLTGCTPYSTNLRKEGFKLIQQSFESIEPSKSLYEVVELKNVKIYIVSDRKYFQWEKASAYGSPVIGYATSKNEIYVFGKRIGDKIVVNQAVIGHELNHLLNFENKNFANPDRLDKLENCYASGFIGEECIR